MKKSIKNTLLGCACAACCAGAVYVVTTTTVVNPDGTTTTNVVTNYVGEGTCPTPTPPTPPTPPTIDCEWIVLDLDAGTASKVVTHFEDLTEFKLGRKMAFAEIDGGTFTMGSSKNELGHYSQVNSKLNFEPLHTVTLSPFAIGIFEVTQGQWKKIMGRAPAGSFSGDKRAVDLVSWRDATNFIAAVNRRIASSGYEVDLPSDAQWEYACRAGTTTAFNDPDVKMDENLRTARGLSRIAVYMNMYGRLASNADEIRENANWYPEVGTKKKNDFDLYDMHGGVWEWCKDTWAINNYYVGLSPLDPVHTGDSSPADPPVDPAEKYEMRTVRGGGYWFNSDDCRSANRHGYIPSHRERGFGFRLILKKK